MSSDNLCLCCLGRPPDKNLTTPYTRHGKREIYGEMLQECFKIKITTLDTGICKHCVVKLQIACDFKQQVLQCQSELNIIKVTDEISVNVKEEVTDDNDNNDADNGIYFLELKEEDSEFDLKDDNKKLAELFGLSEITIKKRSTVKTKKGLLHDKSKKGSNTTKERKKEVVNHPLAFGFDPENRLSDSMKHKLNVKALLKHSNCTPFLNKTIAGIVCGYCKDIYPNIQTLRTHTQETHTNHELITSKRMDKHSLSAKLDITDLHCKICLKPFDLITKLKQHLIQEHDIRFYSGIKDYILEFKLTEGERLNCALCHSTFETFKMLLQHMNGHYRNYVCKICDQGFINKQRLRNHEKTHDIGSFSCSYCDKVFTTKVRQACHEKYTHDKNSRYTTICPHCNKSFNSYYHRNRHMAEEHNTLAATYKCNICDKSFLMKSKLTSHIKKVHLMERNHICSECGLGFFIRQSLEEHMVKHKGERVFKCTVCNKAYARKKTLREHMRIHNNDRRFKCGVCLLAFVQKCSLKSHMLSNHGISLAEYDSSRSYEEQNSPGST